MIIEALVVPHFDNRLVVLPADVTHLWVWMMILFVYEGLNVCALSGFRYTDMADQKDHQNHSAGFCSDWQRLPPARFRHHLFDLSYQLKIQSHHYLYLIQTINSPSFLFIYTQKTTYPTDFLYLFIIKHRIQSINQSINQSQHELEDSTLVSALP